MEREGVRDISELIGGLHSPALARSGAAWYSVAIIRSLGGESGASATILSTGAAESGVLCSGGVDVVILWHSSELT